MAHQHYLYLKLLLRNNLQLEPGEYVLIDTKRQGLACGVMGMKLSSVFQPVLRADGKVIGREALLRAGLQQYGELATDAAFALAVKANRVVQFDRLVRIIHLMNHARSFAEHELLFLKVHPQLLASVSGHGYTFERILHYYSVPTSQVVIEIRESANTGDAVLTDAVGNYRRLGYRIALNDFGAAHSSLERALELRPDIVKLERTLIRTAERSRGAATSFGKLMDSFHGAGIQVAVEGIETARQLKIARQSGADLLQGHYLARPEFAAATHDPFRVAEKLAA